MTPAGSPNEEKEYAEFQFVRQLQELNEPKTSKKMPKLGTKPSKADEKPSKYADDLTKSADRFEKVKQDHDTWWKDQREREKREEDHNPFLRFARWLGLRR